MLRHGLDVVQKLQGPLDVEQEPERRDISGKATRHHLFEGAGVEEVDGCGAAKKEPAVLE